MRPWQQAKPGKIHIMSEAMKNVEGNRKIQMCCCAQVMSVAVSWTILSSNLSGSRQRISERAGVWPLD